MDRLFKRSNFAKTFYLSGLWDFCIDPEKKGEKEGWFQTFPDASVKMPVPSCWNTTPEFFRYTGTVWYRTRFLSRAENLYITFEAVNNECDVYLDGKHIGYHYGGFLEFGFEIDGLQAGEHELVLRVNNETNDLNTYPLTNVDWFNYGGISRPVEIRELSDTWIKDYKIDYQLQNDYHDAVLSVRAEIKTFAPKEEVFEVYVDDVLLASRKVAVDGVQTIVLSDICLSDIRLWGVFQPNLYHVRLKYGQEDIIERIGFREIKTCGRDILLNGEKLRILGINRHEEHPDWGFSMPFELIKKDIDLIRRLNCNAIRTSHYPNSKKTADYCDEIGMLFWEELPLWGRPAAAMADSLARERVLAMEEEMILRDYHHPSIIIWSMHNECATDTQEGYALTKDMTDLARRMDSSRLITYVSNHAGNVAPDICYDLVDIACMNNYTAWYGAIENDTWDSLVERLQRHMEARGSGDKPLLITEFGAGGIAGVNTLEAQRWTEDYQADYLTYSIDKLQENERLSGTYIWQYSDLRTSVAMELARPRSFNNKGVVDEFRRPKRAFRAVQKAYGAYLGDGARSEETWLFSYQTKKIGQ